MTAIHSRRSIVTGLAAAPVLGLPAIAAASAEPDPVFALIERHRRLYEAIEAKPTWQDDALSVAVDECNAAWDTLLTTPATTLQGCAVAMLYVVRQEMEENMSDIPEQFADFCKLTADALKAMAVQS
jgi:hypothetical protein